jgi:hypothetical protein
MGFGLKCGKQSQADPKLICTDAQTGSTMQFPGRCTLSEIAIATFYFIFIQVDVQKHQLSFSVDRDRRL